MVPFYNICHFINIILWDIVFILSFNSLDIISFSFFENIYDRLFIAFVQEVQSLGFLRDSLLIALLFMYGPYGVYFPASLHILKIFGQTGNFKWCNV